MRVTYDSQANAAYIDIDEDVAEGSVVENVVIERPGRGDIVLDIDAEGYLLGVEVIGASDSSPCRSSPLPNGSEYWSRTRSRLPAQMSAAEADAADLEVDRVRRSSGLFCHV